MTDDYLLLGGLILSLLLIALTAGFVFDNHTSLMSMLGELHSVNMRETSEVKEMLKQILEKESLHPQNCHCESVYEKILLQSRKPLSAEELSENATQTNEEAFLSESIQLPAVQDTHLNESDTETDSSRFSDEEQCEMGKGSRNRKTEEKVVQTDEIESITLSACYDCRFSKEKVSQAVRYGKKSCNLLTESESKPGIYQPPKRSGSLLDFSSDQSSNGDNSFRDRKRSVEFDSDSDCSDWRKVQQRKHQNPILFCEMDKNPPVRTPSASPVQSSWNLCLSHETRVIDIREMQQNQINAIELRKQYITEKETRSPLIIGVDARPTIFSGYCLNLKTLVCQFYSFPSNSLPWKLHAEMRKEGNSSEFEMKNMMFALLLWENEIEKCKKFSIFTDNGAVNHSDCQYGHAVTTFLEHLTGCKNNIRVNSNAHVHRRRNLEHFSRYIQPADDLSHFNMDHFKDFIRETYGGVVFTGSHDILDTQSHLSPHHSGKLMDRYPASANYKTMLEKGIQAAKRWTTGCNSCGFYFPLKSLNGESKGRQLKKQMKKPVMLSLKSDKEKGVFTFLPEDFPSL